MQTLRLAWRNLWRNPRRSAITAAAIALNTAILIATEGLMAGMVRSSVSNTTNVAVGEAQIHAPGYRERRSFYDAIDAPERILEAARGHGIDAAPRSFGVGLASVRTKSAGAQYWGVDLAAERAAFSLVHEVARGRFLSPEVARDQDGNRVRQAVLGRKLARSLEARVGAELVAVVQAADGSMGNELFVVQGILKTIADDIDRSAVLVHRADFDELFVAGGRIHQIALNSHGKLSPEAVVAALRPAAGKMELLSWKKLAPAIAEWIEVYDASMAIFGLIFFLSAGLGVLNSMLMATFERTRELGVIKALGGTPWRVVRDVSAEALVLGLCASLVGALLGLGANLYLHHVGIDLSSVGNLSYAGVAFDPLWRSVVSVRGAISPVISMCIVAVLAALYPAIKAARLDPVRAMTQV